MDNQQLRSILLKLQDRLSDNDRQRLHFILGNDIPRRIRDNLTHNGTLNLLDCLIDQDKINERDFTFLINAFKEIQCVEAVKILAEFKRLTALNDKTSLGDEITQDQDDCRDVTHAFIPKVTNYGNFNNIINTNSTNINPVTITMENQTMRQSSTSDDRFVKLSLRTSVYVCAGMLFFVVVVGLLLTMLLVQNNQRNGLDGVQKHGTFFEEQTPTNSKTGLFNQILAERDAYIRQLEDQLTLQQIEKVNAPVVAGQKFGVSSAAYFDDSLHPDFTRSHYFNGFGARDNEDGLESYQFLYSSSLADHIPIESDNYGKQTQRFKRQFSFLPNERVVQIEGRLFNKTIESSNGTNTTITVITGLQFSTADRASPTYEWSLGTKFTEERPGYTLGYITGRAAQYVEQVQFFWYRKDEIHSEVN